MRNTHERAGALLLAATCAMLALGMTTPAAAQFGGLKRKVKAAAGQEAAAEAQKSATESPAGDPAGTGATARGGTVVLTPDLVDKLVAGLKAAEGLGEAARKENTSYGRYQQALAAYQAAKPKCEAAQQTYPNRLAADEKMQTRSQLFIDKLIAAQQKGDTAAIRAWADSSSALQDPNCAVHQPNQPTDYYETQCEVDSRAEKAAIKASGLTAAEWAMGLERGEGIIRGNPPPDASASEKSAVNARAAELKSLLGIQDAQPERARKPAPPVQPAAAQPAAPAMPPGSSEMTKMTNCMAKNAQKHQKEIEALGERAKAAQKAGDMNKTLAIADTLQQLQMAGCTAGN